MKLQVNNSGAWKNVMTFGFEHIEHVKLAVADLAAIAAAAEESIGWRIVDSTETAVLMLTDKRPRWHAPVWMLGREIVP